MTRLTSKKGIIRISLLSVILITTLLFTLNLVVRSYLTYGLIPVGWDTGVHLYYVRLILDGRFDIMFDYTNGNNFFPFILTALLALVFNNIIIARVIMSISLPILLLIIIYIIVKKVYKNTFYALISIIVSANWLTTYRLSSDLHRTIIAFIFIIPLFYLYNKENKNRKDRIVIFLLILFASFSQIEITILFTIAVFFLEVYRVICNKKIEKKCIINFLILLSGIAPAFITAISKNTYFITVSISYSVKLDPPTFEQVFMYFGGSLIFFTLIGFVILTINFFKGNFNHKSLIAVFNIIIIFFLLIPSFIFEYPTIFRRMSGRSITILLVPFLIVESLLWISKIISKKLELIFKFSNMKNKNRYLNPKKVAGLVVSFILISSFSISSREIPIWAGIHQKPFVSEKALTQLSSIMESRDSSKKIISLMRDDQVKAYKNFGWAGLYLGYHHYFNGPSTFLAAGIIYPSVNPQQITAMDEQIKDMKDSGIFFPLSSNNIEIAIITEFYGPLTQNELKIAMEIGEGAYIINGTQIFQLLNNFAYYGINYYSYEGNWRFFTASDYYASLESKDIEGVEEISYALLFFNSGNYSININHFNGALNTGGFSIYINETYVDQLIYWGAMDYRNFTINLEFDATSIGLLKIKPLMANQSDIMIKEIFVEYSD
ncbi:MAG: hypothetical protein ACFFEY_18655 [Candidatus Thorarchaeota archaeon]